MEVRSESLGQARSDKDKGSLQGGQVIQRTRLQVWFVTVCFSIVIWTCLVHLVAVNEPRSATRLSSRFTEASTLSIRGEDAVPSPPLLVSASEFKFLNSSKLIFNCCFVECV